MFVFVFVISFEPHIIDWEVEFEGDDNKYYVNLRTDVMTMNERPRYIIYVVSSCSCFVQVICGTL